MPIQIRSKNQTTADTPRRLRVHPLARGCLFWLWSLVPRQPPAARQGSNPFYEGPPTSVAVGLCIPLRTWNGLSTEIQTAHESLGRRMVQSIIR